MTTSAQQCSGGELNRDHPSTSSAAASPASRSPSPDDAGENETNGGSGLPWRQPFASYDRDTHCWRTCQDSLWGESLTYSQTWPRAGMTRNGIAYPLPPSVPRTSVIGSTSLLPTPRASDGEKGGRGDLLAIVRTGKPSGRKYWPTPTVADALGGPGSSGRDGGLNLRTAVGGQLNPQWTEWLMGFPPGWTDCER